MNKQLGVVILLKYGYMFEAYPVFRVHRILYLAKVYKFAIERTYILYRIAITFRI